MSQAGLWAVGAFALVVGCGPQHTPPPTPPPVVVTPKPAICGGAPMRVRFFDVGQALSVLVELPDGRAILVDAGESPKRPGCGAPCQAWNDHLLDSVTSSLGGKPIDLLWITHPHSDHLGGVPELLEKVAVKAYADNGRDLDKKQVQRARSAVVAHGAAVHEIVPGAKSPLGDSAGLTLRPILPATFPPSCAQGDVNDCSIGLRIDYCQSSVLFTGDAEAAEEALLDPGGPVTLLQVGHHGSETSSSAAFLAKTTPRYAVISSGKPDEGTNATYCHPRKKTVEKLDQVLGGQQGKALRVFDGVVSCKGAGPEHWADVPTSDRLFATARDGDVTLVTTGDGTFVRK